MKKVKLKCIWKRVTEEVAPKHRNTKSGIEKTETACFQDDELGLELKISSSIKPLDYNVSSDYFIEINEL